jgi:ABC-type lipopolysaccharide export system ATPase subunit
MINSPENLLSVSNYGPHWAGKIVIFSGLTLNMVRRITGRILMEKIEFAPMPIKTNAIK